ncbi:hypothetical protein FIBSPDRAFT_955836 [Athelia psychrophila]|uniref:Cytochrome c oxidase assembly protein COX20, mitochondrial n=1 Tax=Athelia psychrophila TaxID=1759441 RepID=A0A166HHN2_9AGAM|nr:hypothetical protein FIBSPDRAFT_955836 [Fibularhizoctonia sp. CBS 109695]
MSTSSTLPEKRELPVPENPPVYQVETTGSRRDDFRVAWGRVKQDIFGEDDRVAAFERIPCARNSLMGGIGTGVGVGVIRGLTASSRVAFNWALLSFMVVGVGSWKICQSRRMEEKQKVERIMEALPKRFVKKKNPDGSDAGPAADAAAP